MRKTKILLLAVVMLAMFVGGCQKAGTDPNTGEVVYVMDSNALKMAETGEQIGEIIIKVAPFLSVYWPPAMLITGILGGVLGAWKKLKPQVTAANTKAQLYYDTTGAVVSGIERFKIENPEEWLKLEEKIKKMVGPEAENVIRALRGLAPVR